MATRVLGERVVSLLRKNIDMLGTARTPNRNGPAPDHRDSKCRGRGGYSCQAKVLVKRDEKPVAQP